MRQTFNVSNFEQIVRLLTESACIESDEHWQALEQTGFWGNQGAGCILLARSTGRLCIAHRSKDVEEPHTWGTWGGAIDSGENPATAAKRELQEEAGYSGHVDMVPLYVFRHPSGFTYYNFLAVVDEEFSPEMDWETQGYRWFEYGQWPKPLHRGMVSLLNDSASTNKIQSVIASIEQNSTVN